MQQVVYKCNFDGKEIGRVAHITLSLQGGSGTGIAIPQQGDSGWNTKGLPAHFLHFHAPDCMARYFTDLLNKLAPKAVKKVAKKK